MTIWLVIALVCMIVGLICMFMSGKEDSAGGVGASIIILLMGVFFFWGDTSEKYQGYASSGCESGTYRLSTVDGSDDKKLYITVRDYKDYALRLCAVEKKNAHVDFSYYLTYIDGKVTRPKNVRIVIEPDGFRHLYPAE